MELLAENIRTFVLNATNQNVEEKLNEYSDNSLYSQMKNYVNENSMYYIKSNKKIDVEDRESMCEMVCFTEQKPKNIEQKIESKGRGRPKKSEIDKLMTSIMSLVTKHIDKEVTSLIEMVNTKFNKADNSDETNFPELKNNLTSSDSDVQNENNITNALIQASQGISVECADEIQKSLFEISNNIENEELHIEVSEIMIHGNKYYIDENNNIYNIETSEMIGRFDTNKATIIKVTN